MPLNPPQAYRKTEFTHRRGERATQPLASDVLTGTLYFVVDEGIIEISDGTNWQVYVGQGANVSNLVNYSYSSALTSPPGANQVRFNAPSNYSGVTRLYFWNVTSDGQDIKVGLLRIQPGAVIYVQKKNDDTQWASFQVTSDPIDHTTWTEYVVVPVGHGVAIGGGQLVLVQAGPGPTYTPPAHAPTHETGGTDALAHLAGGVIDSGTVATARLQPAGSDKQVQFNDSSLFGATSGLTFNKATGLFSVGPVAGGRVSVGVNAAAGGSLGIANSALISARNNANSGDIPLIYADSTDIVYVGDVGFIVGLLGGQLKFPATQIPSSDPNILDDYEEGTWTPSLGGSATYNARAGHYTKIGRQVVAHVDIDVNTIGTGSATTISGLPFAAGFNMTGSVGYFTSSATNLTMMSCYVNTGNTQLTFTGLTAAANGTPPTQNVFGNATVVNATVTYFV